MNHPGYTITTYLHDREAELKRYDDQYRAKVEALTAAQRFDEHTQLLIDIENTKYRPLGMSVEQEIRDIERKITILQSVR